jgi:hypothetical protein
MTKLSAQTASFGASGVRKLDPTSPLAASSESFNSSTMMVVMMAMTPSLNAAMRSVPTFPVPVSMPCLGPHRPSSECSSDCVLVVRLDRLFYDAQTCRVNVG